MGVKTYMGMERLIGAIVVIVIGISLITTTAVTVASDSANLEDNDNLSATAQTIVAFIPLLYVLMGLGLVIGGFGLLVSIGKSGKL